MTPQPLVIDTNIVLDLLVYQDAAVVPLRLALVDPRLDWLATDAMHDELARVLTYPHIARRLLASGRPAADVMAAFGQRVRRVPDAPRAPFACKDGDDQKFIDLAVAHRACLLSKDAAVLCMARRLARVGVPVARQWLASDGQSVGQPVGLAGSLAST